MQYQIPRPTRQIQGPTVLDALRIPSVAQIEMSQWSALQAVRLIPGAIYVHQGPIVQSADRIPGVDKLEMSRYAALDSVRRIPGAVPHFQGPTVQQTIRIPAVATIEMSRYSALDSVRLIPGASVYLHQGATVIDTLRIPSVAQIEMSRWTALDGVRLIPGAIVQIHTGATIQRTDPIGIFGQPVLSLYPSPQYPTVAPQFTQAAIAILPIFPQPLPNLSMWPGRVYPDVPRQLDGATVQQTYVFRQPRPHLSAWPTPQYPTVAPQLTQAAAVVAQTFTFTQPQPNLAAWPGRQFPGVPSQITGATSQQTYVFPPRIRWRGLPSIQYSPAFWPGIGVELPPTPPPPPPATGWTVIAAGSGVWTPIPPPGIVGPELGFEGDTREAGAAGSGQTLAMCAITFAQADIPWNYGGWPWVPLPAQAAQTTAISGAELGTFESGTVEAGGSVNITTNIWTKI